MRFLRQFFRYFLLVIFCLWLATPLPSISGDVPLLCLSGENQPRLRRPNDGFSTRVVAEAAQARAYLSPAVFLGTLRSVLVQRDGTVRAWFAVDNVLKMDNGTAVNNNNRRRSTRASRTTHYTRVSYSKNKYIGEFVSLPAVRPRNPSELYRTTYTRAVDLYRAASRTAPTSLPNWTVARLLPGASRRSPRTALVGKKPEDTEVLYPKSGPCVLEVNQDNLRLGGQYMVFGQGPGESRWPSLIATALPISNERRILRAVKKVLCAGCAQPPSIEGLDREMRVEEGGRARFHCHLAGNPIPWVEWFKDGRRITNRSRIRVRSKRRTSRLVIRHVRTLDRGVYECRAGNVVAQEPATATTTLIVKKKRRKTTTTTTTQSSPWTTEPCPTSDFCNNGGTCIFYRDVGEYVCQCAEGFVGLRCDYKDVRVSLGEVRNSGPDHDRLLIAISVLFLVFFCLNWTSLGICWLCCFRNKDINWGKFREMAPLRKCFKKSSLSSADGVSVNIAMELTSSQNSSDECPKD